ncbi:unnamed protein product, partial [Owenia fusiformis]
LLPQNRKEIEKWLEADKDAINWDEHIQHICELDNNRNIEARKSLMRSKIKDVIWCNALLLNPIAPVDATFDVVGTSFMLECAAGSDTPETFRQLIKNASNLVKPGGFLVQLLSGPCTYWRVKNVYFRSNAPTREYAEESIRLAGFDILKSQCYDIPGDLDKLDGKEMYLIVSQKR